MAVALVLAVLAAGVFLLWAGITGKSLKSKLVEVLG